MSLMVLSFFLAPCVFLFNSSVLMELILCGILIMLKFSVFLWDFPFWIGMNLFMDKMSFFLVLITLWIFFLMVSVFSEYDKSKKIKMLFLTIFLLLILLFFFTTSSFIVFFSSFELSMIPVILIILGSGYQPERINASLNFFYFTSIPSMPFLVYMLSYNPFWVLPMTMVNNFVSSGLIYFLVFSLFLVKMPLFMVHYWLPKAHVEAPVSGSMVLAGILLKMGGYGLMRLLPYVSFSLAFILIMSLSGLGMVYACLLCLMSSDLKSIIAYSSVSHMNYMIISLMTGTLVGSWGSMMIMLSHALCSSGMFYMCDVSYKRSGSRSILLNKSSIILSPFVSFWWFILCLLNMAFPFTLGNLSELFLMYGMFYKVCSLLICLILMIYFLFSAYYSIYIYTSVNHGSMNVDYLYWPMSMKEIFVLVSHVFPCLLMLFVGFLIY